MRKVNMNISITIELPDNLEEDVMGFIQDALLEAQPSISVTSSEDVEQVEITKTGNGFQMTKGGVTIIDDTGV